MDKTIKGRILEKRYNPARPGEAKTTLGRGEDEFQLLVEQRGGEPVWITVTDSAYNAAQPGAMFRSGRRRNMLSFRGVRGSGAKDDLYNNVTQGWISSN